MNAFQRMTYRLKWKLYNGIVYVIIFCVMPFVWWSAWKERKALNKKVK